jgi:hypothetical protein
MADKNAIGVDTQTVPGYYDGHDEKQNKSDDSGLVLDAASKNSFEVRFHSLRSIDCDMY